MNISGPAQPLWLQNRTLDNTRATAADTKAEDQDGDTNAMIALATRTAAMMAGEGVIFSLEDAGLSSGEDI